ncbi:MAG: metallophosphoesterase, partial [Burkholderiaceae bacterium]
LHLSDPHLDMDAEYLRHLVARVQGLVFDACVVTGDFRFHGHGPFDAVLDGLQALRPHLGEQVHAVLGNHDTIRMVPGMEARGYRVLMNEAVQWRRGAESMGLAGIDDAHFFQTHDLDQALAGLAPQRCAVLLSHTPQPYRQAAAAGVQLMLSGHTHGGQVCLPGGIPILTDTPAPRFVVRGAWNYQGMAGYTSVGCGSSVVDVRLNCLPEITLHQLRRRASAAPEKD